MPLPVISNTYRCALKWTSGSAANPGSTINVLHVRTTSEDETGIANVFFSSTSSHEAGVGAFMPNIYGLTNITVTKLDGTSGGVSVDGDGAAGQASGDYIPQGAVVLSLSTGARGPQGRGRIYVGPVVESQQTAGVLYQPSVDSFLANWQGVFDDLDADNVELVVASYRHSVARTVTSSSVHPFLRTQRKRQKAG
jgi:hypothetical protein